MDERRYELVTLAAARRLRSTYCCLAHGTILAEKFGEPVREIMLDHRAAGLSEVDVAVIGTSRCELSTMPRRSMSELSSSCASSASRRRRSWMSFSPLPRCFFSKTLDALDIRADANYGELDAGLREPLVVGRPIADA